MRRIVFFFGFITFALLPDSGKAQIEIRDIQPSLTLVSVQPETGFTEMNWASIQSQYVAGFRLLYYINDAGFRFKTLWNPSTLKYIDSSKNSNYHIVSYQIEAIDSAGNPSKLSNKLNTIFTTASIDTCIRKLQVRWNSYLSLPKKVSDYSILLAVNGGSFAEFGNAGPDKTSFSINEFISNAEYCFVVKANLEDGTSSTSNKACLSTKMQRPPSWINADFATVDEKKNISLSFSVDPLSEIYSYRLERKTENENEFSLITQIETKTKQFSYTDKNADPMKKQYYRLLAVNNCGNPIVYSNLAGNIITDLKFDGNLIYLTWNSYNYWLGDVLYYKVFMDTGSGFREEASLSSSDTSYTINYSSIMYKITMNNICLFIGAFEKNNPHGISGEAASSRICTDIIENITVPNTFTPNNDLKNDFFKPILSFSALEYHLVITDRRNKILFESHDQMEEWDGKLKGESLPDGVYLWFLNVKTPSGKVTTKTGTVTIIK
jgi:gliding motility-associated-like protein